MTREAKQVLFLTYLAFAVGFSFLLACGGSETSATGGATAVQITGPGGGVTCYAILNGNGEAVGGNCK